MAAFVPAGAGGVPVTAVIGTTGTVLSTFATVSAVATNATVTILSYTVPPGKTGYLLKAEMSGTNIATYDVLLNAAEFARIRTYFSGPFDGVVTVGQGPQDAYKLSTGDVVSIQVTNFRPTAGDFECRLQVIEV
jgi:hypothetical protein